MCWRASSHRYERRPLAQTGVWTDRRKWFERHTQVDEIELKLDQLIDMYVIDRRSAQQATAAAAVSASAEPIAQADNDTTQTGDAIMGPPPLVAAAAEAPQTSRAPAPSEQLRTLTHATRMATATDVDAPPLAERRRRASSLGARLDR